MPICNFVAYVGFEGGTVVQIAPVPGHCLPFTFDLKHQEEHFKADRFSARRECLSGHVICFLKQQQQKENRFKYAVSYSI